MENKWRIPIWMIKYIGYLSCTPNIYYIEVLYNSEKGYEYLKSEINLLEKLYKDKKIQ